MHCLFDKIGIIFEPLTIAIFQFCLLPKMRLSVDLEGRFTGYKYTLILFYKQHIIKDYIVGPLLKKQNECMR